MNQVQQRKGVESFETNDNIIFVLAPIESVSEVINQLYSGKWQRDVYGREINNVDSGLIIMQFLGHSWTMICGLNCVDYIEYERDAVAISRLLVTHSIQYHISDTGGELSYKMYQKGECIEKLQGCYGEGFQFDSKVRSSEPIRDVHGFIDAFFQEQGIYVPVLLYNLSVDKLFSQQNAVIKLYKSVMVDPLDEAAFEEDFPMFERSDFERVDYIALERDEAIY